MRPTACWFLLSSLCACGEPAFVLPDVVQAQILPAHGSVGVTPTVEVLVYFTHAIAEPAAVTSGVELLCLGTPPCSAPDANACATQSVDVDVTYDAASNVAHVRPSADLAPLTCYAVVVPAGIESSEDDVGPLPTELRSSFATR